MIRETAYDTVLHAQLHFRSILDSMSRPGKINRLEHVDCQPPGRLAKASALVALALLNADVSFHLLGMTDDEAEYLAANTGATPAPIESATFIFCHGAQRPEALEGANCGSLAYPDTSATVVIQVDALSNTPLPNALRVEMEGPGVDGRTTVYARALSPDLLLALQARNVEFPLGLDAIVTCQGADAVSHCVLGIPRTARLSWER